MIVGLCRGYPGLLATCDNCHSLSAYGPSDIHQIAAIGGQGIICPFCRAYIKVELMEENRPTSVGTQNETNKEGQ